MRNNILDAKKLYQLSELYDIKLEDVALKYLFHIYNIKNLRIDLVVFNDNRNISFL